MSNPPTYAKDYYQASVTARYGYYASVLRPGTTDSQIKASMTNSTNSILDALRGFVAKMTLADVGHFVRFGFDKCFRSSRLPCRAIRASQLAIAVSALSPASCAKPSAAPALAQDMRITLGGEGRDIRAEFRFTCRKMQGVPEVIATYRPDFSSMVYIADNRQTVVITGVDKKSDGLCTSNLRSRTDANLQNVPLLIWLNNVDHPTILDVIDPTTPIALHKYRNYPQLTSFQAKITPTKNDLQISGRAKSSSDDFSALEASGPSQGQFLSPLIWPVSVKVADAMSNRGIVRLLRGEIAPGVWNVDLCKLSQTADGDYFFRVGGGRPTGCPIDHGTSQLPANSLAFGTSQPMLYRAGGHWSLVDRMGSARSYLRADDHPLTKSGTHDGQQAYFAPDFWLSHVKSISIDRGSSSVGIPSGPQSAVYLERDNRIFMILGDGKRLNLNNPIDWKR